MGLKEKRNRLYLEEEIIPDSKKTLKNLFAGDVDINISWESFATLESMMEIEHQVLGRIISACRDICIDDLAKEAMQESLKSISVINLESSDSKAVTLADGVLLIQEDWTNTRFPEHDIKNAIESVL